MKKNIAYFILILLFALYLLNPSYNKHLVKLGEIPADTMLEEKTSSPGSKYKYKNYVFCSMVADAVTDQRKSFGILGFVLKSE